MGGSPEKGQRLFSYSVKAAEHRAWGRPGWQRVRSEREFQGAEPPGRRQLKYVHVVSAPLADQREKRRRGRGLRY